MARIRKRWDWVLSFMFLLLGLGLVCFEPAATFLSRARATDVEECNGVSYDPETEACCDGVIYNTTTHQCCEGTGGTSVIPYDYVCCDDGSNAPSTGGCCGATAYDDVETCCCDGENVSPCPPSE